jgi:hypothetical protein
MRQNCVNPGRRLPGLGKFNGNRVGLTIEMETEPQK